MRQIDKTNKFELSLVKLLNAFEGWDLKWVGDENLCYDAIGKTPKGVDCVMEMKFRKKYYDTKLIEKKKFDNLMALDDNVVKIYFVSDPQGTYFFWLNKLKDMDIIDQKCPSTTFWRKHKIEKQVYMLKENWASIINKN
jgi:hypothetical protein